MIKEKNNMIEVWGHLNAQNMNSLSSYLEQTKRRSEFLVLSLDHVKSIDPASAKALESAYYNTAASQGVLTIIGQQNDAVHQVMRNTKTSYILSHDRI
nr:STAS domain-containing protein [Muriicola jejuensis]